jgi:ABC-type branched-subunit amino acid transport system ATPase component
VGERKLLSLGCLLMNDTSFILLDELTSGLNGKMIERMNDVINQLNKSGVTFLMIEHDDEVIKKHCTKTYEMQNGKLIEK